MKLQLNKNIDVVQINVKAGVSEYYFPTNVDWANKKIDRLIIYGANPSSGELSPIDGVLPILNLNQLDNVYLDLYAADNTQIAYGMSATNILYTNNHPFEINSGISLQTSKIVFSQAPTNNGCILVYVFCDTKIVDSDDIPNRSVTVQFPIKQGEELPFNYVIDTYIHSQSKTVKGLYVWGDESVFITLRDYNYKTITKLLPGAFCRPQMAAAQAQSVQVAPLLFENADVNFDNSFIYNAAEDTQVTITFLY